MNDDPTWMADAWETLGGRILAARRPRPRLKPTLSYDRHGMTPGATAAMEAYVRAVNGLERAEYENALLRWNSGDDTARVYSEDLLDELRETTLRYREQAKAALVSWEARLVRG